jgi:hypothetical protein
MTGYAGLDNVLWVLLQLVRSAPLGGRYITQAIAAGGHTRKLKFFTWPQLHEAAHLAVERGYNRQLDLAQVDGLRHDGRFPITFTLPHEHANGQPVPMHMRCLAILDSEGGQGWIDTDMGIYNSLDEFDAPDPRRIATPSAN